MNTEEETMEIDAVDYEEFGDLEQTVQYLEDKIDDMYDRLELCLRLLINTKKGGKKMCQMTREEVAKFAADNLDAERKYTVEHITQSAADGREYLIVKEV